MAQPRSRKKSTSVRTVQSVDRAVAMVELLADEPAGCALSELAERLKLAPQTAQSLLRTLQHHGWVSQAGRAEPYRLGPALPALHRRWSGGQDRAALAEPIVSRLSRHLREYVVLDQWTGHGLEPLVEVEPERELVVRGESFSTDRLHAMATGKLLMAGLDESRQREVVASLPLEKRGPRSVTDPDKLLRQFKTIRRKGYVVCREESSRGVVAVAVPVCDAGGRWIAALGTSLPLARYGTERRDTLLEELTRAAREVARAWGETD